MVSHRGPWQFGNVVDLHRREMVSRRGPWPFWFLLQPEFPSSGSCLAWLRAGPGLLAVSLNSGAVRLNVTISFFAKICSSSRPEEEGEGGGGDEEEVEEEKDELKKICCCC